MCVRIVNVKDKNKNVKIVINKIKICKRKRKTKKNIDENENDKGGPVDRFDFCILVGVGENRGNTIPLYLR